MLEMTLLPSSFRYGALEIDYADVVGAGVGVTRRRLRTFRTLLVAYRVVGAPAPKLVSLRLRPADESFAMAFAARVPERWCGEDSYFGMRRRLGISNARAAWIVGTMLFVVVAVVLAWAYAVVRGAHP